MTSGNPGALAGQTLGEYKLEALIGAGGMAEVYRGRDTKLGRDVAVKVLPPHLATDAGYVARFRDEARRVATIDHANIVPVYQFGEERGLLYIVMPLLRESLRERMERTGLPAIPEAMRITVQVAAALDAAHGQGIIHRDVKPENVLLNQEGRALLTDFGIAREAATLRDPHAAHTISASGLPVGTPEYMAPEQLRREYVDQRADIYALGAVLYEMLTGHAPHEASSVYEVAAMALTASITPPSSQNQEIWPQLDVAVMTALAKDANERYPDARSFALALRAAIQSRNDPRTPKLTVPAYQPLVQDQDSMVLRLMASGPLREDGKVRAYLEDSTVSTGRELAVSPRHRPAGTEIDANPPRRRRMGLLLALVALIVLVGTAGGGTLYILSGFSPPGVSFLPLGNGAIAGPGATATSTAEGTPGATATSTAGRTGALAQTPTSNAPTPIPGETATATPTPPSLVLAPSQQLTLSKKSGGCSASQIVLNAGSNSVSWSWTLPGDPTFFSDHTFLWGLGSSATNTGPPTHSSLAPSSSDTLTVQMNCQQAYNGQVTVIATDLVTNLQSTYTFTLINP